MASPPVTSETFPSGAGICWIPLLRKYAVVDSVGHLHGYRNQLDAAREFAANLPDGPPPPPKPAVVSRSPHAMPVAEAKFLPAGLRRDESHDFPAAWIPPRLMTPFERSRELCRRQAEAHDRVYRRHTRGR